MRKTIARIFKNWFCCPEPEESIYEYKDLLCIGFYNPIIDDGTIYNNWRYKIEKEKAEFLKSIETKNCPYLNAPCSKSLCVAFHKGYTHKHTKEIPISEKILAWIEQRPINQSYIGYSSYPRCKKGVF